MTPLNSAIGYEEAAAVAKQALKERKTIRQTVIDRGLIGDKLSIEELDRRLDVLAMARVKPEDLASPSFRNFSGVTPIIGDAVARSPRGRSAGESKGDSMTAPPGGPYGQDP